MSGPDDGRPAVPRARAGEPGWPTAPPPLRPLGAGDPAETGPYRLEAVLGAGGMGRVYLARTPAGSAVAVKVVHREYAGDAAFRKRFAQEVAAARRVQGLYTVPVVDADLRADEPWLATAYVPGPSLQQAVAESGPLPAAAALALIARVAEALQSIHAADVIHRDLKPSNILLTADGPKVIDFGIARAADLTAVTATGVRAGTPAYMAPEYIRGQTVTEAGDIFALGGIAHFAVTGGHAFGGGTDHGVVYRILEQEPDLDGCPEPVRAVAAACLAKDPDRRPTPAEVIEQCRGAAADGGHPATVVAPPAPEPAHPATEVAEGPGRADAAATAPAAPGATAGRTVPGGPGAPAAPGSPDLATRTAAAPAPGPPAAPGAPAAPAPDAYARTVTAGGPAVPPPPDTAARGGPASLALLFGGVGAVILVIVLVAVFLPSSGSDRKQQPSSPYGSYEPTGSLAFPARAPGPAGIDFSPDGRTLVTGGDDGKIRFWDVASRKQSDTVTQKNTVSNLVPGVADVEFSPDGKLLATGTATGGTGLYDVAGRRWLNYLHMGGENVAFAPDGKLLAIGSRTGSVYLFDPAERGDDVAAYFDHDMDVTAVAFSPDGKALASAGDDSEASYARDDTTLIWDVAGRDPEPYGQDDPAKVLDQPREATAVAYSPDGETLAVGFADGGIRLWDLPGGKKRTLRDDYLTTVADLEFSPDGKTLATTSESGGGVLLWNVARGKPSARLVSGEEDGKGKGLIEEVTFSPDGKLIAGADRKDRAVRLWKNPR
ncbi:WD40 repeat domain-containing serine/threonine protein kinase [Streptomyces aculeolatus]|uniref:WD40 repeat domain-containing serine/threonine protein kinase n=1 Tax=Streptomyces aculeolatus TaxID=270689 RepID=UPI001CED88E3|nr:WD40 repeat domain-containing serine/threonine protein kinase [Streptomyces aculeolatus]